MAINYTDFQNVAIAISAYAQERWTEARLINSTKIVTNSADISGAGEGFAGQLRWYKPIAGVINNANLGSAAAGSYTPITTTIASYIKAARSLGAEQVNMQQMLSKQDGLTWFANNFAQARAADESDAILSVLRGVAGYEAGLGAGIVNFDTLPSGSTGAFVDINAAGSFGAAATGAGDARKLVDSSEAGAGQGQRLFKAMGMFWKDYEPDYAYLLTSPEVLAELRVANLVDDTKITEGNIEFLTLFGGKFRILLTRSSQGNFSASANVNDQSTKTSFIVKEGSVAFQELNVPVPTEIDRNAASYAGTGSTNIWYRYGFVAHPMGYDWKGSTSAFATNANFATAGSWERKVDPLNLGILPIFHA